MSLILMQEANNDHWALELVLIDFDFFRCKLISGTTLNPERNVPNMMPAKNKAAHYSRPLV